MSDLSDLTKKYRIFYEEGAEFIPRTERGEYQELRGVGDTRIYVWGNEGGVHYCCISTESTQRWNMLSRIPGVQRWTGCVIRFPSSMLKTIAEAVHARRKRVLSEEQRVLAVQRLMRARAQRVENLCVGASTAS